LDTHFESFPDELSRRKAGPLKSTEFKALFVLRIADKNYNK